MVQEVLLYIYLDIYFYRCTHTWEDHIHRVQHPCRGGPGAVPVWVCTLSRAAFLEWVKATELICTQRGTSLLCSHSKVRFTWWMSYWSYGAVTDCTALTRHPELGSWDCQPSSLGNLLVVIPSFPASPHLKAKITAGVLVFVSRHYEQDLETENLISCWSHLLITVAYWTLYLIKPCQAFYV